MSPNGFRLLTLGHLALEGGEGDPAADALRRQRRKLAVLAVLALAQERLTRDALTEMFWGDQDEARARHSLSEALSALRRVLGPNAITARGPEVALSERAGLEVDARELMAAVQAGRWSEALTLHGGPFLDAVDPGGSRRLESWIDAQRRELERLFARACEGAYTALRSARCWEDAVGVARRWLEVDPLSESAALALLGALEATEDRDADARALREYRALRTRLERDYGAAPGARVEARAAVLLERLAAGGADATVDEPDDGPAPEAAGVAAAPAPGRAAPSPATAGEAAGSPPEAPGVHPRGRRRPRALWWAAVAAGIVVVGATASIAGRAHRSAPGLPATVAVLPFPVAGPAEYSYLSEGVVDLLSADLDGAGPYRTIDPHAVLVAARTSGQATPAAVARQVAERLGAGLCLLGDVVVAGGRIRLSARLVRPVRQEVVAEATVEGRPDELFRLVDQLTVRLLAASGSRVPALGRLAALTTASLPALKHYLEGESDLRRGLYASAFDAFRAAAQEDTTFALAHYRMAQSGNWGVPLGWSWDSAVARSRVAAAHASRLAPRARLLVDAYAAWMTGSYDQAERGYRAVVRSYPDDVEAWTGLGEVLFHSNPPRGRPFLESGPPFERVLALEPDNLGALTHLLRIRLRERRLRAVDSLVERLVWLAPPARTAEYHVLRAFVSGTAVEQKLALARLRQSGDDEMFRITAHRLAIYAGDRRAAGLVLAMLLDRSLVPEVQAHARIWLAQLEIARGRWRAAEPELAAAAALYPPVALEERGLLAALPFGPPDDTGRIAAVASALTSWDARGTPATTYPWLAVCNGLHETIRQYLLGLLQLRRGDRRGAEQRAASVAAGEGSAEAREFARGLAESLRAHVAAAEGRADALSLFDAAHLRVSEGLQESQFGSQALERWTRAELLLRLGRPQQALPWYASLAEAFIDGLIYQAPAELRQAEIYDSLGDRRAAAAHYTRFVELWAGADPELRGRVERARLRLAALQGKAVGR